MCEATQHNSPVYCLDLVMSASHVLGFCKGKRKKIHIHLCKQSHKIQNKKSLNLFFLELDGISTLYKFE